MPCPVPVVQPVCRSEEAKGTELGIYYPKLPAVNAVPNHAADQTLIPVALAYNLLLPPTLQVSCLVEDCDFIGAVGNGFNVIIESPA